MLSPAHSYQNSLFSNLSDEEQKHIDAIRPHFFALKTKYTKEQIYTLLTLGQFIVSVKILRLIDPRSSLIIFFV
jgi:hypothetical protein